jgi:hypothetical protein
MGSNQWIQYPCARARTRGISPLAKAEHYSALVVLFVLALVPRVSLADTVQYSYNSAGQLIEAANTTTGRADILSYDANGNLVNVSSGLISSMAIAGFTPSSGTIGSQVTISGTGFDTTAANNVITFNGTAAVASTATSTQLSVAVPTGATTGRIVVSNPAGTATSASNFTVTSNPGSGNAPLASVAPSSLNFGNRPLNATSTAQNITVTNNGTAALNIAAPTLTGANPGDFSIASNGCGALAVGQSCIIAVTFTPSAMGGRAAGLQIPSDASNGTQAVTLNGLGIAAVSSASPASLAYGSQLLNVTSAAQTVTVTNTGSSSLTVSSVTLAGTNPGDFAVSSNGCSTAVAPAGTCTITVTFKPTVLGGRSAVLQIASNASNGTRSVTLSGTGIAPAVGVSPTTLAFGNQVQGTVSAGQTVTVTNSGTAALHVGTPTFSGANAGDYAISSNGCLAAVAAGANCTIILTFTPSATGSRVGTLQIPSDASNGTQSVSLTGTGIAPVVGVSPNSLTYGNQIVATTSAAQTVTVSNTGTSPLTVGTPILSGANANDYTISSNSCSAVVAGGATCTINVTFTPNAVGSRAGTLQIPSDASNGTQSVSLTGTGIAATASISPASLSYASQLLNTTSSAQAVTVTNSGTSPLHVGIPTLSGTNPGDFAISSNGCTAVVAVAANCTISVTFRPTAMGSRAGTLQIPSDATNGTQSVPLTGTGIAAVASVTPMSLTYNSLLINTTSAAQAVTVTNSGTSSLTVSSVTLAGANPGDFAISSNGCAAAVAAGANCAISVTFRPTVAGSRNGTLQIASNANNGTQSVPLAGTGIAPTASVSPTSLTYAGQLVGSTSSAQTVTLTNTGTAALHVSGVTLSGTNAADFAVSSNGCAAAVAAGQTCVVGVTFTPSGTGSRVGTLQIASDATNGTQSVALTATGIAPLASVAPSSLNFGNRPLNAPSTAQSVTVTNSGTAALNIAALTLVGANASDFAVSGNGCSAAVAAGQTCTISLTFTPSAAGSRVATLQIPSDASNGTQSVGLSGIGIAPAASVSPTSLAYGNQLQGSTSAAQTVTVTNTGSAPLHVGAISLAGTNANNFAISSNGCSAAVAAAQTCAIGVTFTPSAMGSRVGTLQIPSDATNGTLSVSLSGTGIAAVAAIAPASLTYGNQLLNTTSAAQSVTVTNSGTSSLTVSSVTLAGSDPGDFAVASNGCSAAVAPSANCTISVTFKPTAQAGRSGTLQIASNANNGTQSVPLSGTGIAPVAGVSPGSLTYASQLLGSTSVAQTVTVTNSGTAALHVGTLTLSGANASDYAISSTNCGTVVAASGTCTISLTFAPNATGSRAGVLQIPSDATNGTQSVSLAGTGVTPIASVSPATATYTNQLINTTSAAQTITVTNTGSASLTVGSPVLSGTSPGDYAISSNGCSAAIAVSANCTISLTFRPTAMGTRTATLQIPSDANNGTQSVSLSGTGIAALASVSPATLAYSAQLINTTSALQTVTVTNSGTSTLNISGVTLAGANPGDFAVSSNGCTAAVAVGGNCTISVTFKPLAVGSRSGTLQIVSNANNGTQSVALSGTGVAPAATASPTTLAFGNQLKGTVSVVKTVTITNSGTAALHVGTPTIGGTNAGDFAISANGCTAAVAASATCTLSLTFTPPTTGSRIGTLQVPSDATNGTQSVSLTGTGIAPAVAISPATLSYSDQLINTTSAVKVVTVTNSGSAPLHVGTPSVSGTFAIASNGCGAAVAVGANCAISLSFTPTAVGSSVGNLQIPSDATNGTQTISLSGNGVAPSASASPSSVTYADQIVGSSSAGQAVTVTNTGTAPLHVSAVSLSGSNPGDFSVASNGCASPVSAGLSCTVTLTFVPTAMGGRSATVTIASDALNGAQSVSLIGTGIAPIAGVSPSSQDFGVVLVLLSSNPMYYTVTNSGTSPLNVGTPSFSGANPGDFIISSNGCTSPVAVSQSCSIGVTFKPANGGSRSATLQVPSDAFNGTQTATATGTAVGL